MDLKSLKEIFNDKLFRIPDYQRGYSWGEKQLTDLWRDFEALEDGKIHYTGLLSVDEAHQEDSKFIHVVDGQQRLTTLITLIHCICKCSQLSDAEWINGKEKSDYTKKYLYYQTGAQGEITEMVFGYQKDNPSHEYFKTKILGLDGIEQEPTTLYTNNLDGAKQFFEGKLKMMDRKAIESLLQKITDQLQFLYYPLDNKINQFVAFETMNYRGKPLTTLELLKNRLMYISTELSNNDEKEKRELRKEINDAWKSVYEHLGKNPEKELSDDEFLMAHWIMYFDEYDRSASKVFASFLLDEHFTLENVRAGKICYGDISSYALDIAKVVKDWYYMHNPDKSEYSAEVKFWLEKLNRLNFRSFRPLVASILANNVSEEKTIHALETTERFNFVLFGLRMNKRQSNYKAVPIYQYTYEAHKAPNKFHPENLNFESLEVGSSNYSFTQKEFVDFVHENNESGFHGWDGVKYFLHEYEIYSQQETKSDEPKLTWGEISKTIEHIYPQTPKSGEWKKFKGKSAKRQLHELGNLLIISRATNSRLGNRSFTEKKDIYSTDSYAAIAVSKECDWTPETIQARQAKMLDFLWKRWGIDESQD